MNPAILIAALLTGGAAHAQTAPPAGNVWQTESGQSCFTDPVTGEARPMEEAAAYNDYNGRRYYHCRAADSAAFRADPEGWLQGFALPAGIVSRDAGGALTYRDPVNGLTGTVSPDSFRWAHEGRCWFFSSKKTLKLFRKNPPKYLAPPAGK